MVKDGTNQGGRRVRAGAKPDPLNEKLAVGRAATTLMKSQRSGAIDPPG